MKGGGGRVADSVQDSKALLPAAVASSLAPLDGGNGSAGAISGHGNPSGHTAQSHAAAGATSSGDSRVQPVTDGGHAGAAAPAAVAAAGKKAAKAGKGNKQSKRGMPKSQIVCKVDTCHAVLSSAKAYYQRHRVCAAHLAAMSAQVDGVESRFCQQCGKFQPLEEFDADKRSCRSRLKRHNNRRREQRHNKSSEAIAQLYAGLGCARGVSSNSAAALAMFSGSTAPGRAVAEAAGISMPLAGGAGGGAGRTPKPDHSPGALGGAPGSSSGTPHTGADDNSSHAWNGSHEVSPASSRPASSPVRPGGLLTAVSLSPTSRRPQAMRRSSASKALEALRTMHGSSTSTTSEFEDDGDDMDGPSLSPGTTGASKQRKKAPSKLLLQGEQQRLPAVVKTDPGRLVSSSMQVPAPAAGSGTSRAQAAGLSRFAQLNSGTLGSPQRSSQPGGWPSMQQQQQPLLRQRSAFDGLAGAAAAAACLDASLATEGAAAAVAAAAGVAVHQFGRPAQQHSAPPIVEDLMALTPTAADWEGTTCSGGQPDDITTLGAMAASKPSGLPHCWSSPVIQPSARVSTGLGRAADSSCLDYRHSQRQKLQHYDSGALCYQAPQHGDHAVTRASYSGMINVADGVSSTFQQEIQRDSQQAALRIVSSSDDIFRQQQQHSMLPPYGWQAPAGELARAHSYSHFLPPAHGGPRGVRSSSTCGQQQQHLQQLPGGGASTVMLGGGSSAAPHHPVVRSSSMPGNVADGGRMLGLLPGQEQYGAVGLPCLALGQQPPSAYAMSAALQARPAASDVSGLSSGVAGMSGGGRWSHQGTAASSLRTALSVGAADSGSSLLRNDLAAIRLSTAGWHTEQQAAQASVFDLHGSQQQEELDEDWSIVLSLAQDEAVTEAEPGLPSSEANHDRVSCTDTGMLGHQGSSAAAAAAVAASATTAVLPGVALAHGKLAVDVAAAQQPAASAAAGASNLCSSGSGQWALEQIPSPSPAALKPELLLQLQQQQQQQQAEVQQQQQHGCSRSSAPGCLNMAPQLAAGGAGRPGGATPAQPGGGAAAQQQAAPFSGSDVFAGMAGADEDFGDLLELLLDGQEHERGHC